MTRTEYIAQLQARLVTKQNQLNALAAEYASNSSIIIRRRIDATIAAIEYNEAQIADAVENEEFNDSDVSHE